MDGERTPPSWCGSDARALSSADPRNAAHARGVASNGTRHCMHASNRNPRLAAAHTVPEFHEDNAVLHIMLENLEGEGGFAKVIAQSRCQNLVVTPQNRLARTARWPWLAAS